MSDSLSNDQYSDLQNQILLRKGFRLKYEFSDQYADLAFITGQHITGTSEFIDNINLIFIFYISILIYKFRL